MNCRASLSASLRVDSAMSFREARFFWQFTSSARTVTMRLQWGGGKEGGGGVSL